MSEKTRKCPHCGEVITDISLTVCPACAEDLPKEEPEVMTINCAFCGEKIDKNAAFCPNCGEKIKNRNNEVNKPQKNNFLKIVKNTVITIFAIILLIQMYHVGKSMYLNFMIDSLYGSTKRGLEYLDKIQTINSEDETGQALRCAYSTSSHAIKKHKDKDMPYAIKGYASWGLSGLYYKNNLNLRKNSLNYKESKELTDKALSINPNNYVALQTYAEYNYILDNNLDKALEYLNKALKQNPKYADAYFLRAKINIDKNGSFDNILEDLDSAIKYAPNRFLYYSTRANIKMAKKDYDSALKDANKSIELCPTGPASVYMTRSKIKEQLKDFAGAIEDCDKVIEITKEEKIEAIMPKDIDKEQKIKDAKIMKYDEYRKSLKSKL